MRGLAIGRGRADGCASLGYGKRVIGQIDQLREHVVLPDFDFDAN